MPVSATNRLDVLVRGRAKRLAPGSLRVLALRLRRTMRAAGIVGAELSLTLSDDPELHALNRSFAGEDHATDVLSFCQAEGAVAAPQRGRKALGDIVISVEYAARQAQAQGRALPGELFHLAVHGLAHLLGFDHRDAAEERVMFGYETALRRAALGRGPVSRVSAPRRGTASRPAGRSRRARPQR